LLCFKHAFDKVKQLGTDVRVGNIPIWFIEVLSTAERLRNALKEAGSVNVDSEASRGSFNEA